METREEIAAKSIIGKRIAEIGPIDIGSFYPVLSEDNETIVGVHSAEFGTPKGYVLDEHLQAFVLGI